ncbi:hypothetical protein [Hyphobacterium marinum]|uniref:Uncharacterized protein n=1 Tax=Hyphobacterium marinum TaxID=3116574 RepID=A0ABU7LVK0_9PROT|nr:hypothetical protein [Hyphobacterium sp. Y6023]MEE2565586.1 hypothetical protein [Hyphobacterium sp. Y6023]
MDEKKPTRFDELAEAAGRYGDASLDNYALIRSLAEAIASGFCRYLGDKKKCVYLVPPTGAWAAQSFGSGAFSVSGKGFLPLSPISFGLAVRVSHTGDWIRLVITAAKQGPDLDVSVEGGQDFAFRLPFDDEQLQAFFAVLYARLTDWFNDQADHFENGAYGGRSIGFEFTHDERTKDA